MSTLNGCANLNNPYNKFQYFVKEVLHLPSLCNQARAIALAEKFKGRGAVLCDLTSSLASWENGTIQDLQPVPVNYVLLESSHEWLSERTEEILTLLETYDFELSYVLIMTARMGDGLRAIAFQVFLLDPPSF
ncbi:MAG: hypothetical protein ACREPR_01555 [Brasilonema sp.]